MIKLNVEYNSMKSYLNDDDLKRELIIYSEKNNIPKKIIDKTYDKLKEKKIQITKDKLELLIKKITEEIQKNNKINKNDIIKNTNSINKEDLIDNTNLIEILKNIDNRMLKLEKNYSDNHNNFNNITDINQNNNLLINKKNNSDIIKLNEIPLDAQSIVILMKWIQYLIDKLGKDQISDVLNFYVDVGWISEDIKFDLLKYVKGMTDNTLEHSEEKNKKITTKEHIHSLLFIQKLKGKNMDDFLWKIDQDLEKSFKNIEYHYSNHL